MVVSFGVFSGDAGSAGEGSTGSVDGVASTLSPSAGTSEFVSVDEDFKAASWASY